MAGVIGPLIGNFGVKALGGGYRAGFIVAAVLGVIAAGLSYSIRRPVLREAMSAVRVPAS